IDAGGLRFKKRLIFVLATKPMGYLAERGILAPPRGARRLLDAARAGKKPFTTETSLNYPPMGRSTRKVVPKPGLLSTSTDPRCDSTIPFTMASPRPLPLTCLVLWSLIR